MGSLAGGSQNSRAGFTFVELLIVTIILLILASAVMPLAQITTKRQREAELRRGLRDIRTAIDSFKDAADQGVIGTTQFEVDSLGYPPTLDVLVDGVPMAGDAAERTLRFLRRIPVDPMTGSVDWGLRAYQDPPTPTTWRGGSVFDVYSRSLDTALDGSRYREW